MSLLNRVVLPAVAVFSLAFLVACGSNSNSSTPPPSGGFSATDFNGTYTFSIAGRDLTSSGTSLGPLSIAGTITACGCSGGTISAGTMDITDTANGPAPNIAIDTSGSHYQVNADGTGTVILSVPVNGGGTAAFQFYFVLTDAAHGLIMEFDNNGSGSGTIDLQPIPVTLPDGSYAFSLSGGSGTALPIGNSLSLVGSFTLASGAISSGLVDFNNNANVTSATALTGSISTGAGTGPGTATLSFNGNTLTLDVYAIDATHLKLVERDGQAVLIGDLFSQPSAMIPTGNLTFTMAGVDPGGNPLGTAGIFASDGTSGSEDFNDGGTIDNNTTTSVAFTGTFTSQPSGNINGRFLLTMSSGFVGGTHFAAYPSSGGVLMLEVDSGLIFDGMTAGAAMAQASGVTGLASSQGYGLNLTGFDLNGGTQLDQVAQFNITSSIKGVISQNDFGVGGFNTSNIDNGVNTPGSNGPVGEITFNGNTEGTLYYGVSSTSALALGVDSTDVSLGVFVQQGSPSSTKDVAKADAAESHIADVAQRHLAMIKSTRAFKRQ